MVSVSKFSVLCFLVVFVFKFSALCWLSQVVGVPVTLNGDLKNQFVETNVGFDTICKVIFLCPSQLK